MDNETQRLIEKLLRAAARKRREQAGRDAFEMHPASRRLLQGEVARVRPARQTSRRFSWLWPRLAWGAGVAAAVVLLAPRLSQDKAEYLMAKKEDARAITATAPAVAPPPAIAAPSPAAPMIAADRSAAEAGKLADKTASTVSEKLEVAVRNELVTSSETQQRKLPLEPPAPVVAVARPTVAPRSVGAIAGNDGLRDAALGLRADAPGAKPAVADGVVAVAGDGGLQAATSAVAQATDSVTEPVRRLQEFAGAARGASAKSMNAPAASSAETRQRANVPAVLNSFQFVQSGNKVKVIDEDGSVYAGAVEENADEAQVLQSSGNMLADPKDSAVSKTTGVMVMKSRASKQQAAQNAQNVEAVTAFNVIGTNRTLNQRVVFNGNLMSVGNQSALNQNFQNRRSQAGVSQIKGTARVGDGQQELKIDAEATP